MERLTLREATGCVLPGFENNGVNGCYDIPDAEWLEESIDRLAAIEDILGDEYDLDRLSVLCNQRMTMRDEVSERFSLTAKIPLDRLREIAEAERDGRCVVLPCKVEDDVYINILGRTLPFTVISISQMISTTTFKAQHGIRIVYIFKADDVGETVFMTRAEAEDALRREQDG